MKTPLLIALVAVVFGVGSTLAIMNNACKSSHHAWCAPVSSHPAPHKDWAQLGVPLDGQSADQEAKRSERSGDRNGI